MVKIDENTWTLLGKDKPSGERMISRMAFPDLSNEIFVSLDSSGFRHLLFLVGSKDEGFTDTPFQNLKFLLSVCADAPYRPAFSPMPGYPVPWSGLQ